VEKAQYECTLAEDGPIFVEDDNHNFDREILEKGKKKRGEGNYKFLNQKKLRLRRNRRGQS